MLQFNQIISYMAHIGTDTSLSWYKHIANTFSKMNQMYMPEVKMHHFHFHPTYGLKSRVILRSRFIRLWQCCNKNRWGFNNKAIHNPETCSTTPLSSKRCRFRILHHLWLWDEPQSHSMSKLQRQNGRRFSLSTNQTLSAKTTFILEK